MKKEGVRDILWRGLKEVKSHLHAVSRVRSKNKQTNAETLSMQP